jgi:hypothetical protein
LPPQFKKSAAIASAKFVVAEHKAALVYWSFGFRLPRGSSAKAAHSFVLQRQSGSDHSCFVIYRQEISKSSKHDHGSLPGLRSKTSLNTPSRQTCVP